MRSVSSPWKLFRNLHFVRFYGVPSLAHFVPYLADSGSDEQSSDSGNESSALNYSNTRNLAQSVQLCSYDVFEMLRTMRNEPLSAFSFFNQLKENGFQFDVHCYLAIIEILCQRNSLKCNLNSLFIDIIYLKNCNLCFKMSELLEVMVNEIKDGRSVLIRAFGALVKSYVSVGMFVEAINTLLDIKRYGFTPCLSSFNYLINRLTHYGKTDIAASLYMNMKNLGLSPNTYTYAILVKAYSREAYFEKVWEIFLEMHKELQHIDAYCYNAVIQSLSQQKRMLQAESVFLEMLKRGLEVNYRPLIHGYCGSGDIKKALTACDEMENNGMKTDCVILTSILQCLTMRGKHNVVIELFSKFKAERNVVDKVAYNVAINALCKMGRLDEAMTLFEEMKSKKLSPDVVHYTTLITGCCMYGKILFAKHLFGEMKLKGIEADAIAYDVLAGGISRSGLLDEIVFVLNEMKCQGLKPRLETHNKIIEGLCSGGKVIEARRYFMNVYPKSIETYASMINGYCDSGMAIRGYEIFHHLLKKGIVVSKCCFKLLNSLCLEGENDIALKLFKNFPLFGIETTKIMCGTLVHSLCRAGEMQMAQWVFDQMVGRGLSPDVTMHTMLMHGYFLSNCLQECLEIFFTHMKVRSIYPDTIAYTVFFDGLSKKSSKMARRENDVEGCMNLRKVVSELWTEMKSMKMKPDTILYTVLIDSNCKFGNVRDAAILYVEMIERGLMPDTATYTALISGYCMMGDMETSYALLNEMQSNGVQPDKHTMLTVYQGIMKAKMFSLKY